MDSVLRSVLLAFIAAAAVLAIPQGASAQCASDRDCKGGRRCVQGNCTSTCTKDTDCSGNLICEVGTCRPPGARAATTPAATPAKEASQPGQSPACKTKLTACAAAQAACMRQCGCSADDGMGCMRCEQSCSAVLANCRFETGCTSCPASMATCVASIRSRDECSSVAGCIGCLSTCQTQCTRKFGAAACAGCPEAACY